MEGGWGKRELRCLGCTTAMHVYATMSVLA